MEQRGTIFFKKKKKGEPTPLVTAAPMKPVEPPTQAKVKADLSSEIRDLVRKYQAGFQAPKNGQEANLHVDEIASKVAALYERIRKIIDWKEEHLIRRTAIERHLKRRLIPEISQFSLGADAQADKIAEPLILDLIRGGHLSNDSIPQGKIKTVEAILKKYIYILKHNSLAQERSAVKIKDKINFYDWLVEIAACEIEETLAPPIKENALIESMSRVMFRRIRVVPEGAITEEEKGVQTYIAVHKALFRLDAPIIRYRLIKKRFPQWLQAEAAKEITANIFQIQGIIENHLAHPLGGEFFKVCEKYDTIWLLLADIFENFATGPDQILPRIKKPEGLRDLVKAAYEKRLLTLKTRLYRMAVYSTLSIFVAGGFTLFIVEVPLARLFYGRFNLLAIIVDILVPTLLMFFLVATAKAPSKENFGVVLREVKKIVYPDGEEDLYEINAQKKKRVFIGLLVGLLYLLGSIVSTVLTVLIFYFAQVPITSVILDTLNMAVVFFAGLVIRQRAKEITIEEKATFWEFSLDILSVPMAKVGQWLAGKWKEWNIVSIFLTALVDMPFLAFIGFLEGWSSFLKEKKAEIH